MLEGVYAEGILNFKQTRPHPQSPQETSGITLGAQGYYRYSLPESEYPVLSIVEDISDSEGNTIPHGHYSLALSDDTKFLILIQSQNPVAIVPTFKLEEDKSAYYPSKKLKKIREKQAKERAKTNAKRLKSGLPPDEEKVNMEASLEYIKEGNYYLIKYERGAKRAWGAIKAD